MGETASAGALTYFIVTTSALKLELWCTDGTSTGTRQIKTLTQIGYRGLQWLMPFGDKMVFRVVPEYYTDAYQLWITDGTAEGTQVLMSAVSGLISFPLIELNGSLWYQAFSSSQTRLWRTDGTAAGTAIFTPVGSSYFTPLPRASVNGLLYFSATPTGSGIQMFSTDGGTSAPVQLTSFTSSQISSIERVIPFAGGIYFLAKKPSGVVELWVSDGTSGSGALGGTSLRHTFPTAPIIDAKTLPMAVIGQSLYFPSSSGGQGNELWISEAAPAGTLLLVDLEAGAGSSSPNRLQVIAGQLYFGTHFNSTGGRLWKTDGTALGTQEVLPALRVPQDAELALIGSTVIVPAGDAMTGFELYGIQDGTHTKLAELVPGPADGTIDLWSIFDGVLWFTADVPSTSGRELWRTDGTPAGTFLAADISPGRRSSSPGFLSATPGGMRFTADDGQHGREIWQVSAGEGANLIRDISTATGSGLPKNLSPVGSKLFFTADDGDHGRELWVSDGSSAGTRLVVDIFPGDLGAEPVHLTALNGQIYFHANDGSSSELWRSDGSAAGTVKLSQFGAGTEHRTLFTDGTFLYSAAVTENALTIWRSAGVAGDEESIATLPGSDFGSQVGLYAVGGEIFLDASVQATVGGVFEYQIRRLDDSTTGSSLIYSQAMPDILHDIRLREFNGALYFQTGSAAGPTTLWKVLPEATAPVSVSALSSTVFGQSALGFPIVVELPGRLAFVHPTRSGDVWVTDGSGAGTFGTGFSSATDTRMIFANGFLYYSRQVDRAVYKVALTAILSPVQYPIPSTSVGLQGMNHGLAAFGQVFLDNESAEVPWVISPSLTNTVPLDAYGQGMGGASPQDFTATTTHLFYTADTPGIGREIFGVQGVAQTELSYDATGVAVSVTDGIDFGGLVLSVSKSIGLRLINKSASPVTLTSALTSGGAPAIFGTLFPNNPTTNSKVIPPLGSISGSVFCRTTTAGSFSSTLTIQTSETITPQRQIPLSARDVSTLPLRIDNAPATSGTARLMHIGQSLEIQVPQTLTPTSTLRWLKNGTLIPTANQNTLSMPALLTSDAATYRVEITEQGQATQSASVHLALVSSPADVLASSGSTIPLMAKLTTPSTMTGSATYLWQRDQVSLLGLEPMRILGVETSSLSVQNCRLTDSGKYRCRIQWTPPGMTVRELFTTESQVQVVNQPEITTTDLPDAYIGQNVSVPLTGSQFPQSFSASGLPPGIKFNTSTGVFSGQATSVKRVNGVVTAYSLRVTCTNPAGTSPPKTLLWRILPLPEGIGGNFCGLVDRHPINQDFGGRLILTVTSRAGYSAALSLGTTRHNFSGVLAVSTDGSTASFQTLIRRGKLTPLTVSGTIDASSGQLLGTILPNGSSSPSGFEAKRVLTDRLLPTTAQIYNARLQADAAPESTAPKGTGFISISIRSTGVVTLSGRVADGSSFTASTALTRSDTSATDWCIGWHQLLRTNTGSIQGWQEIVPQTQRLDGIADWRQTAQPRAKNQRAYRLGFAPQTLNVSGSRYLHTPAAILDLDQIAPVVWAARFIIELGETEDSLALSADPSGKLTFTTTSTHFPRLQSCRISTSGLITAQYLCIDSTAPPKTIIRANALHGLIIPHLGQGIGFALMPDLTESADPQIGPTRAKLLSLPLRLGQAD